MLAGERSLALTPFYYEEFDDGTVSYNLFSR